MKNPFNVKSIREFVDGLSCANIDVKPISYSWNSGCHKDYGRPIDNVDEDDSQGMWREIYPLFDLANANRKLKEFGADEVEMKREWLDKDTDVYEDEIELATSEANYALHEHYRENSQFQPMMNYYYTLDAYNWKDKPQELQARLDIFGGSCLLAELDDEVVLTLMGGGMDLSWDICLAYILADCLPPAHFASDLPEFYGMKLDKKHKIIIAACERSLRVMKERQERGLQRLRDLRKNLSENSKKAKV